MAHLRGNRPGPSPAAWASRPSHFAVALGLATALHIALLLPISIEIPAPAQRTTQGLEILILHRTAPSSAPDSPEALAQIDHEGDPPAAQIPEPPRAEETEDSTSPSTPPPAPIDAPPEAASPPADPEPTTNAEATLLAEAPSAPVELAQILATRNTEIARLNQRVRERAAAYTSRLRRKAVSASTREYKYASYLDAWRRKVERIGNLNYPEEAKARELYGNLILHVAVRADGHVEGIRVLRSSGHAELDQAAVRIVELAAPFAPFPPDIRAEADVLDITRTWQFLHGNRLGWDD